MNFERDAIKAHEMSAVYFVCFCNLKVRQGACP